MKFSIRNNKLEFYAEFYGKYSVICGDSAIGKTTLYDFLHEAEDGVIGYDLRINVPYHVLDKRESTDDIKKFENTLLIMDESCKLLHLSDTATVLRESPNRFLIISRVVPSYLPLGIKNLYTIEYTNGIHKLVQVYDQLNLRDFQGITKIITEDSDAGFDYFKENFDIECESSFGNGNLETKMKQEKADKSTLVVFDSAGIVPVAKKLYKYLRRHNVSYLDWDSFESYILTQPAILENIDYDNIIGESIEQISSLRLHELLGYYKKTLPKCLVYKEGCNNCSPSCRYSGCKFSTDLHICANSEAIEKLGAF